MCKKIDVDKYSNKNRIDPLRVVFKSKCKNSPYSCNVAPNSRVHKSSEEWNS